MIKDPVKRREYARNWVRKRRSDWFSQNGPCVICGSSENLELDHIDPETKISHSIWSWSEKRRIEELVKCQILCKSCHNKKTSIYNREIHTGQPKYKLRKISDQQVLEAKELRSVGITCREIGKKYGVSHNLIAGLTSSSLKGKRVNL